MLNGGTRIDSNFASESATLILVYATLEINSVGMNNNNSNQFTLGFALTNSNLNAVGLTFTSVSGGNYSIV